MGSFRDVSGKVAFITGAARGLGRGIAEALAEEGVHVVISDLLETVHETYGEIRRNFPKNEGYSVVVDVSNEKAMREAVESAAYKLGRIDIMVNNAGTHIHTGNIWETEESQIDRIMAVNFKGIFWGCKFAAKQMINQEKGTIVNIGSFFGKVGHATSAIYGASKAAVHNITQALSLELAPYHVNVNALCPGLAASEMHWSFVQKDANGRGISFEEMKEIELKTIPLHRYGEGKDLAGAIMWLSSPSGEYITGQLINVNGGLDFT